MKNKIKWIVLLVALVAVVAAAAIVYDKFGDDYAMDNLAGTAQPESSADESKEPEASPESSEESSEENSKTDYQPAPDFTVLNYEGEEVKFSDYIGKPVVLNFWATWCYYCMEEMPDFDKACRNHPEVQFLMVNATDGMQETMESAKNYIESNDYAFEVVFDTKLDAVNAYQVSGFPATFFINAEGELVAYGNGMMAYETVEKGISMITE